MPGEPEKIMVGPTWQFCLGEHIWVRLDGVGDDGPIHEAEIIEMGGDEAIVIELVNNPGCYVRESDFIIVRTQIGNY